MTPFLATTQIVHFMSKVSQFNYHTLICDKINHQQQYCALFRGKAAKHGASPILEHFSLNLHGNKW